MTTRTVPVLAGCVLALGAGCSGGGVSAADALEADRRIELIPTATANAEKVERIGTWNGSDNVLTAWVKVTPTEGVPYVVCILVDISGRINDEDDLSLVVTTPQRAHARGKSRSRDARTRRETALVQAAAEGGRYRLSDATSSRVFSEADSPMRLVCRSRRRDSKRAALMGMDDKIRRAGNVLVHLPDKPFASA